MVELTALTGLAIAQPILALYRANPLELISRQVEGVGPVVLFVALVVLVPPLALLAVEQGVGALARRWVEPVHRGVLAGLLAVLVLQVVPDGSSSGPVMMIVALVAGIVLWRFLPRRSVRTWVRLLVVMPVVFTLVFFTSPDIADLAFASRPTPAGATDGASPSVLFVVFDELPTLSLVDEHGQIDRQLYPSFARLADGATWYPNNLTVASWTALAVPALLTGNYPAEMTNQAHWSKYPRSLFSLLDGSHELVVREMNTSLCASEACPRRPAWDAVRDLATSASTVWFDRLSPFAEVEVDFVPAGQALAQGTASESALGVVETLVATPGPAFGYVHLELPHQPWMYLPDGEQYTAPHPPAGGGGDSWVDEMAAASGGQRHLLQLGYTDGVLGRMLDTLESSGRYDDTAIVVVADHGVAFHAGAHHRAITDATVPDIAYTPLLMKAPGQIEGHVDESQTQTIDVLPTLAAMVGVEVPWPVDGLDLTSPVGHRAPRFYPVWIDELEPGPAGWVELPRRRLVDIAEERGVGSAARQRLVSLGGVHQLPSHRIDDLTVAGDGVQGDVVLEVASGAGRPSYLELRLSSSVDGDLALVLDGEVVATGATGGTQDRELWVVVPAIRSSADLDRLEVYTMSGPPTAPVLQPLTVRRR